MRSPAGRRLASKDRRCSARYRYSDDRQTDHNRHPCGRCPPERKRNCTSDQKRSAATPAARRYGFAGLERIMASCHCLMTITTLALEPAIAQSASWERESVERCRETLTMKGLCVSRQLPRLFLRALNSSDGEKMGRQHCATGPTTCTICPWEESGGGGDRYRGGSSRNRPVWCRHVAE
jgi:hypothetical protein